MLLYWVLGRKLHSNDEDRLNNEALRKGDKNHCRYGVDWRTQGKYSADHKRIGAELYTVAIYHHILLCKTGLSLP